MQKDQLPQLVLLTLLTVGLLFTAMELKKQGQALEIISSKLVQNGNGESDANLAGGTMLAGQELPPGSEGLIGGDAVAPGAEPEMLPETSSRNSVSLKSIEYSFEVPEGVEVEHGDAGGYSQTSFMSGNETVFYVGIWSAKLDAFSPEERDATFDEFLSDKGISLTGHTENFGGYEFTEAVRDGKVIYLSYFEGDEYPFVVELPATPAGGLGAQIAQSLQFTLR